MLIRLSKNSFKRIYDSGKLGYINNQLTKHDRTYNESGADFLSQISRQPKPISQIVDDLRYIYNEIDKGQIADDFFEFAKDLEEHLFVVIGESEEELNSKDISFNYSMENPKTLVDYYPQATDQKVLSDTEDFLLRHDQQNPRLANLQFELTSRCNERCIHCYIPNGKKKSGLP